MVGPLEVGNSSVAEDMPCEATKSVARPLAGLWRRLYPHAEGLLLLAIAKSCQLCGIQLLRRAPELLQSLAQSCLPKRMEESAPLTLRPLFEEALVANEEHLEFDFGPGLKLFHSKSIESKRNAFFEAFFPL